MELPEKVREFHNRVRLEEFEVKQLPGGGCEGRVELAWSPEHRFVGTVESEDSPGGRMRCAAEATAIALERATASALALEPGTQEKVVFEVLDVIEVQAANEYDVILVLVSMTVGDVVTRVTGSGLSEDQPTRAAVLAVLRATNRLLSTVISP